MKTRRKAFLTAIAAGAGLVLAAPAVSAQPSPTPLTKEQVAEIVASPDRSAADRTNDLRRKPEEMLLFIGIRPGITALDLSAAGGYTTELLARAIGPSGIVYGQSRPRDPSRAPAPPAAPRATAIRPPRPVRLPRRRRRPRQARHVRRLTPSPAATTLSELPEPRPRRSLPSSGRSRIPFRPNSRTSIS